MKYDNQLLEKAFALGFMISREGFNGECGYETCAPSRLEADHGDETIEEFIADIEKNHVYRSLRDAAIEYINKSNSEAMLGVNHLRAMIEFIGQCGIDEGTELYPVGPTDVEYAEDENTIARVIGPWRFLYGTGESFIAAVEDCMKKEEARRG
jgi:hypothetical protein